MESVSKRHRCVLPLATFGKMVVEFEFEPENKLCVYRISGKVTIEALMKTFTRARAHEGWSDRYNFLTLLTQASLSEMSASAMADLQTRMSKADPVQAGPRRRAAIVCNDELSRAVLVFWERTSGETLTTEERIFSSEREARAWLAEAP